MRCFILAAGINNLLEFTGPPPGANMGMGMMNPEMMGVMPPHDLPMGFDVPQGTFLELPRHVLGLGITVKTKITLVIMM